MELESERRTERREAEGAEKKRLKPDKSEARSKKKILQTHLEKCRNGSRNFGDRGKAGSKVYELLELAG